MIALLLKASVVIAVLLVFYKLVLERENFFAANRFYLLACLVLACILPFISLPTLSSHQGLIAQWANRSEEASSADEDKMPFESLSTDRGVAVVVIDTPVSGQTDQITYQGQRPVKSVKAAKADQVVESILENAVSQPAPRSMSFWLGALYWFGVVVLLVRLLVQVATILWKAKRHNDKIEDEGSVILNMEGDVAPCSFFRYIFINPASYEYDTYEQILSHEKIHVNQWHSVDLILSELALAFLWFNPAVWQLRQEVEKNIEYQTDDLLVQGSSEEKERYQLNLVGIACDQKPLAITTNYNQSLIKQRILKMNNKRSNQHSYWKYAFVAPIVFTLLLLLNEPVMAGEQGVSNESEDTPLSTERALTSDSGSEARLPLKGCPALTQAVREEDVALVKRLLKSTEVNCIDPDPGYEERRHGNMTWRRLRARTPLTAAARLGNLEIAKMLVAAGADVNYDAGDHGSPMTDAAAGGFTDFVSYLIGEGAEVNEFSQGMGSPLNSAARHGHTETARLLLDNGADIDQQNDGQGSALNAAARNGHVPTAKFLIEQGANVNLHTDGQGSALNAAARNGHEEMIALLLERGADINAQTDGQGSALNAAARNGNDKVVALLLDKGADIDQRNDGQGSALNAAARNGNVSTVELLLDKGAEVDAQTDGQGSALNAAARNGNDEMVKLLVSKGAEIDRQNDGQGSALNAAARNGHLSTVKLLLELGADINRQNDGQGSALNAAARNGHLKMVKFLVENGARVNQHSDGQGTALSAASRNRHRRVVQYLISQGADR